MATEAELLVSSDTVVGIVGAVILTGAMIAVFYYEADREVTGAPGADWGEGNELFRFQFDDAIHEALSTTGSDLAVGGHEDHMVSLKPYSYHVTVTVSGFGHQLDETPLKDRSEFRIDLLDGDADLDWVSGYGDTVVLHYEITNASAAPSQRDVAVAADSEADAVATVEEEMGMLPSMDLTIRVTHVTNNVLLEDPTGQAPLTQSYSVEVVVDHWYPVLAE